MARTKADTTDTTTEATTARPASFKEMCEIDGPTRDLDPSVTSFTCEHGQWVFPAADEPQPPADPMAAARAALAGLSDDDIAALLTEREQPAA